MKNRIKRAAIVLSLLAVILAGPRIFDELFVPYLQLIFLWAPLIIVFWTLSGFWGRKWRRWFK
jgi:hypothetical protein